MGRQEQIINEREFLKDPENNILKLVEELDRIKKKHFKTDKNDKA